MKNTFIYLFIGCVAEIFLLGIALAGASVIQYKRNNDVTASQWSQTLKTMERNSNGKTSCDVKWEDKKMTVTFHFNDITNTFFRD